MGLAVFHRRVVRRVLIVVAIALMFSTASPAQVLENTFHDPRRKTAVGFSQDLDYPLDTVLTVVKSEAGEGVIHGTRIYRKAKEADEIDGAEFATTSNAFSDTPGSGQVFYQVKKKAVAPEHFPGSNGEGTVTVRYIVQAVEPHKVKLRIDAVYVEESLRARYFSDGSVEEAEYDLIQTQLNTFTTPATGNARPTVATPPTQDTSELQNTLAREQNLLADAQTAKQKLEEELKQLQFNTQGRVKSMAVPLKSSPYMSSSTMLTLEKEERVTVLSSSRYWYKVRTPKGEEGWIYYMFLEPLQ
jgi:Bacterial SH3 domain